MSLENYGLRRIKDRGNAHASYRFWSRNSASHPPAYPRDSNIASKLRSSLSDAEMYTDMDGQPSFVPLDQITRIINEPAMIQLLDQLDACRRMSSNDRLKLAAMICRARGNPPYYCSRKLVAMMIERGKEEYIPQVITRGFGDDCLPPIYINDEHDRLRQTKIDEFFRIIDVDSRRKRSFDSVANKYNAPFFTRPDDNVVHHYILHYSAVLPFEEQLPPAENQDSTDSSAYSNGGQGGFGQVQRTKIHPSHYHFRDYGTLSEDHSFAIKKLNSHRLSDFETEISALLRFSHNNKKQLVKLLATYEVQRNGEATYYLIFPWADGSLRGIWKKHPHAEINRRGSVYNLSWIASQSLAIAESISYIHEEYAANLPANEQEKFGRHGDIKAANFLVYKDKRDSHIPLIFLADFGLARFHRQQTRSMVPPNAASPSYRPPEFDTTGGTLSRKSDIWSLGAFFLEFMTWHLKGWDAVETRFPEYREEVESNGIKSDIFFRVIEQGGSKRAIVKPQVIEWIQKLHSNPAATQFVHDMLDLIEKKMLVVNQSDRIKASSLKEAVLAMNQNCKKNKGYLSKPRPYIKKGQSSS